MNVEERIAPVTDVRDVKGLKWKSVLVTSVLIVKNFYKRCGNNDAYIVLKIKKLNVRHATSLLYHQDHCVHCVMWQN
jgi:hypothetical protein